jgi:hypothetical protein
VSVRQAQTDPRLLWTRILALALLIGTVAVIRLGTLHQQALLVYGATACVGTMFFVLGIRALYIRSRVRQRLGANSVYALAARPFATPVGLLLTVGGGLLVMFGRFSLSGVHQDWSALGGIVLFLAWYLIWRGSYAIALDGLMLHYVSLVGGYRTVTLNGIASARLVVGLHPSRPTRRIEMVPNDNLARPIVINRAVFRKKDIDLVLAWLKPKLHEGLNVTAS